MNISSFSAWVPLLAWLHSQQRSKRHQLRVSRPLLNWVAGYFLLSSVTDTSMFALAELGIRNLWLVRLYEIPSFCIVLVIYRYLLPHIKTSWFYGIGISFIIFKPIDWYFFYPALTPVLVAKGLLFSIFGILLYRLPREDYPATRMLSFWVNYGFSLYFFGSLVLFGVVDIITSDQAYMYIWGVHAALNITNGLLVTIGIVRIPRIMHIS